MGTLFYVLAINTDLVSLYSREAWKSRMLLLIFTNRTHFLSEAPPWAPRYVNVYGQGWRKVAPAPLGSWVRCSYGRFVGWLQLSWGLLWSHLSVLIVLTMSKRL
jgi:hypothetical protein